MVLSTLTVGLLIAGIAGGVIGAAFGGLPALSLAGLAIVVGEAGNLVGVDSGDVLAHGGVLDATGLTGSVGFGPVLGPHVAFAGGVAAAAYAGRQTTFDTTFRYHQAKQIAKPLGSDPDVLLVGGVFGLLGVLLAHLAAGVGVPVDPVMFAVVVSAFAHRIAFGYPLVGQVREGLLDLSAYERGEIVGELEGEETHGRAGRQAVEPWLPDHYQWEKAAVLGAGVGVASAYLALVTGSVFIAFGITAASLAFLSLGLYTFPVTHHMALPASIVALALPVQSGTLTLVIGGVFGVLAALAGELSERVFYAHGDTHVDPPAIAILLLSLLITILATLGVLDAGPIPYPVV